MSRISQPSQNGRRVCRGLISRRTGKIKQRQRLPCFASSWVDNRFQNMLTFSCGIRLTTIGGVSSPIMVLYHRMTSPVAELQARDTDLFDVLFRSGYTGAILDLWICVKSDFFLGRSSSTFSENIALWRDVFSSDTSAQNKSRVSSTPIHVLYRY